MRVLIATDGSDFSREAVQQGCRLLAGAPDKSIKIVSVYQHVVPLDTFPQSVEYALEMERAEQKQAEEYARQAADEIRSYFQNNGFDLTTEVKCGAPNQVITEAAKKWNADLIVVGSHGRGFWNRALLGSVSDSVIHHAPCSVLVVRKTAAQ